MFRRIYCALQYCFSYTSSFFYMDQSQWFGEFCPVEHLIREIFRSRNRRQPIYMREFVQFRKMFFYIIYIGINTKIDYWGSPETIIWRDSPTRTLTIFQIPV